MSNQWKLVDNGAPAYLDGAQVQYEVHGADNYPIAYVFEESDARLIAVAPKLLAALKAVLAAERATAKPPMTTMQAEAKLDQIRVAVAQAEEAIAKAEGEQPT